MYFDLENIILDKRRIRKTILFTVVAFFALSLNQALAAETNNGIVYSTTQFGNNNPFFIIENVANSQDTTEFDNLLNPQTESPVNIIPATTVKEIVDSGDFWKNPQNVPSTVAQAKPSAPAPTKDVSSSLPANPYDAYVPPSVDNVGENWKPTPSNSVGEDSGSLDDILGGVPMALPAITADGNELGSTVPAKGKLPLDAITSPEDAKKAGLNISDIIPEELKPKTDNGSK